MRRTTVALAMAAAALLAAGHVAAQETATPVTDDATTPTVCPAFVDADGDGINDNARGRRGARAFRGLRGQGRTFVDANGDGINDLAPDADGDGIPNGQDPDFVRQSQQGRGFVDADGDGINDNAQDSDGDGVINCQDPDYERPAAAGQGQMRGRRGGMGRRGR